ncbi:MAG: hypothetical protein J5973_00030, partial [Eubacterium sp.]|nr:hypothetical protein [Eubacterium sp.]
MKNRRIHYLDGKQEIVLFYVRQPQAGGHFHYQIKIKSKACRGAGRCRPKSKNQIKKSVARPEGAGQNPEIKSK